MMHYVNDIIESRPRGRIMSKFNPGLFYYHEHNNFIGMTAIHTNDFLWSDTNDSELNSISKLRYPLKSERKINLSCNTYVII